MKTILRGCRIFFACVLVLLGIVYLAVEGRLLVSGDWLLYASPVLGFVQYLLRLALAALAFLTGLRVLLFRGSPSESICLAAAALGMLPFLTNGFGWLFLLISLLNLVCHFPA